MSARLKENSVPGDWEEKYQQLNRLLDKKNRQWKNDENNLYKSILRLILSYSGRSDALDLELQSMRDTLKQGVDDVTRKKIIARIIEKTLEYAQQPGIQDHDAGQIKLVCSRLRSLELPDPYSHELLQYLDRLTDNQGDDDMQHALDRIVHVVNAALGGDPANKGNNLVETRQEDCFDEFLNRFSLPGEQGLEIANLKKKAREIEGEQERLTLVDDCVNLLQRIYRQQVLDQSDIHAIDIGKLKESLIQLLEWLPLSKQYDPKTTEIKNQLNDLGDEEELKKIFRKIATLITDFQAGLQEELIEVQGFLKKITLRLKDIESHIHQVDRSEKEAGENSNHLNESVQHSVNMIRDGVEQAVSLEEIKQSINHRLQVIEKGMNAFIKAEQDRRERSEQHVEKLNKRIVDMKQAVDDLQKRIQEERDKAQVDALTGIPNRLAYDEFIQEEFTRWQRYKQPLSLCIIDIDKFKNVNDTYGHKAGDKVLVTVAELCNSRIRDTDFFSRYGGEEFMLILPQTNLAQAKVVAENLRREVDECSFHYAQDPVTITVSCGLAEFKKGDTVESVFLRADAALYTAKQGGRNLCRTR